MKQTMPNTRMMKIITAIILAAMVFSALPTLAAQENENYMQDGSFEIAPRTNWYLGNTAYGDVEIRTDGETNGPADGGTNYMALERKEDPNNRTPYIQQTISGPAPGTYKLSLWYKCPRTESTGTAAYYKLTISEKRKDEENSTTLDTKQGYLKGTDGVWTKAEIDITLDWTEESAARRVSLNLYGYKVGETVCYDLVSFLPYTPVANTNLFKNAAFEDGETGWYVYGGSWGGYASISTAGYTGSCLKLTTDENYTKPFVSQSIAGIAPYTKMHIFARVKAENFTETDYLFFKIEHLNKANGEIKTVKAYQTPAVYPTDEEWHIMEFDILQPAGCNSVDIHLRLSASGEGRTAYYDDTSVVITELSPYIFIDSDEVFYYADKTTATVDIRCNTLYAAEIGETGATVDFEIIGTDAKCTDVPVVDYCASWQFDPRVMAELKREYILSVTLRDADGTVLETRETPLYRYQRPSMMDEDGSFTVDGKPFRPVFAYHVSNTNLMSRCKEIGVNVVQGDGGSTVDAIRRQLDNAAANNLLVLMPLYYKMKPAGHPDNVVLTTEIVTQLKTHPALFGWILIDEPFYNDNNAYNVEENLRRSYKLVRDIDSVHPTFVMECYSDKYGVSAKYADILGTDIYPGDTGDVSSLVYEKTVLACNETSKPVFSLLQTFLYDGYFPTGEEVESMICQALMGGADAIGYFCIRNAYGDAHLPDTTLWAPLCDYAANRLQNDYTQTASEAISVTVNDAYISKTYANGFTMVLDRTANRIHRTFTDGSLLIENGTDACTVFGYSKAGQSTLLVAKYCSPRELHSLTIFRNSDNIFQITLPPDEYKFFLFRDVNNLQLLCKKQSSK